MEIEEWWWSEIYFVSLSIDPYQCVFWPWLLFRKDIHWDVSFMVHEISMVHSSLFSTELVHYLMSSRIKSCTLSDLSVLFPSTVSLNLSQLANHGIQTDKMMPTVNIISWDQQRQMFYGSSPREVAPLSPREIYASVSLLDSGWLN